MRVLLVHSEPIVGDVVAATLRRRGYDVLSAGAQEAVLRASRHEADIVLLDLRPPDGASAPELVALLRQADPALAIICARDWGADPPVPGALELHRPYSVASVAGLFRTLFEGPSPHAPCPAGERTRQFPALAPSGSSAAVALPAA